MKRTRLVCLWLFFGASCLLLPRCVAPKDAASPAVTPSDRLVRTYADLSQGRFVVLADFETAGPQTMVRATDGSEASVRRVRRGERVATGGHVLTWTATDDRHRLSLRSDPDGGYVLVGDWRPFDVLLVNAHAAAPGARLVVEITSHAVEREYTVGTEFSMADGWNLLRIDLREVAAHIPIDRVRVVSFGLVYSRYPATLLLDDIILSVSRRRLLGDSARADGSLYVEEAGNHLLVGAAGRFELAFLHGQIVAWYDLVSDPYRHRNLVESTVLGPVLSGTRGSAEDSAADHPPVPSGPAAPFGFEARAGQRLVESSAVRVVVEAVVQFVQTGDLTSDELQDVHWQHKYRYTIYPTGHIAVGYSAVGFKDTDGPLSVSSVVSVWNGLGSWAAEVFRIPSSSDSAEPAWPYALMQDDRVQGPSIIFLPKAGQCETIAIEQDIERRLLNLRTSSVKIYHREFYRSALLVLSGQWGALDSRESSKTLSRPDGLSILHGYARQFLAPPRIAVHVGSCATEAPEAGPIASCFDTVTNSFRFRPHNHLVRLTVGGRLGALQAPVFTIAMEGNTEAFVYVDHLLHTPVTRTSDGDIVFQIQDNSDKETLVEVILRAAEVDARP